MSAFDWIFTVANGLALLGWIALIVFPGRRVAAETVAELVIPGLLAIAYAGLIGAYFAGAEGGFSSLAEVKLLFASDGVLLAGWLHYLAFDLFVGSWEVRTARSESIPHLLVVPCLLLTFMLGPIGFLTFLIIRFARTPRFIREI